LLGAGGAIAEGGLIGAPTGAEIITGGALGVGGLMTAAGGGGIIGFPDIDGEGIGGLGMFDGGGGGTIPPNPGGLIPVGGGGTTVLFIWAGLGGRLIMAASPVPEARGCPSRRLGRTMRTVSFFGSDIGIRGDGVWLRNNSQNTPPLSIPANTE
jgi:hypothetical protein